MAREFKETAFLKTDLNKYGDNYDHIFGAKNQPQPKTPSEEQMPDETLTDEDESKLVGSAVASLLGK